MAAPAAPAPGSATLFGHQVIRSLLSVDTNISLKSKPQSEKLQHVNQGPDGLAYVVCTNLGVKISFVTFSLKVQMIFIRYRYSRLRQLFYLNKKY